MILFPNAKINLGLDILRRRADGYHDICTIMIPVKWCDVLEIVPSPNETSSLSITGNTVDCPTEKNLVMKAYRAMEQQYNLPPVDIYLRKIIPDGAGLGGGSADAAFTIKGLNTLFSLGLNNETMAKTAASIGADCPFFIYNRPMLCTGTGTDMMPIDMNLTGLNIGLVKPGRSISTAQAYAGVKPEIPATTLEQRINSDITAWKGLVSNAFEPSVGLHLPELYSIKNRLYESGALYASMSGSGSAIYGIWDNDILTDTLQNMFPECIVHTCSLNEE